MGRTITRLLAAAALATPAAAEEGLWLAAIAQGPVGGDGKLVTWLEVQPRFTATVDNYILRPAIGVQVNPRVQFLLGYHFQANDPELGPTVREHRFWQQALLRLAGTPGKTVVVSRTRLEQRFIVGQTDDAMRLRQWVRAQHWLDKRWSAIGVGEAFIGLESTPWGQRNGLEQFRTTAAIGYALTPRLTLETGYLNQRFVRPGPDRANDILNINLFYRIG